MGKRTFVATAILIGVTAALGLVAGLTLPVARAATYTVTNTNPSGSGSLRQAVLDANGNPGFDTIDFHPSVLGTIVLTGALPTLTDDVTITGPGASDLAISGDDAYRVFDINANAAVTISGLTIRDGDASNGGGIHSDGTALFVDTDLVDNAAMYGGGLYVGSGSVTWDGGQIISNTASNYGGGAFVQYGSMTLSGADIMSNTAEDYGGGVHVESSSSAFTQTSDSTIAYNTAQFERGGGVLVNNGSATLKGLVYRNVATGHLGTYYGGGGVFVLGSNGRLDIAGGQIISNTSNRGGGVFVRLGSMTLSGGQIMSNTAAFYGGGLHVQEGNVVMDDVQIMNNTANLGGGIAVFSVATVTISGGQIISNSAGSGGGIFSNLDGTLTLINTTLSGNQATSGSGGALRNDGTTELIYTTMVSNTASSSGGGIFRTSGALMLQNTIVAHNSPVNCDYANGGSFISFGYNLESADTCGLNASTDITDTAPMLGQLTDDGVSWFYPLLDGSPAINAGQCVPGVTTVDTRGVRRPAGGLCDIGAYEWDEWLEAFLPLVVRNY
jgi:hypothetical protein